MLHDRDAHQTGGLPIVADDMGVLAEAVPEQQQPDDDGQDDEPHELHGNAEPAADQQPPGDAVGRLDQRVALAADEDEREPAVEELRADGDDECGDSDDGDEEPVDESGRGADRERGQDGELDVAGGVLHADEADHAQPHDRRERQVDVAAHDDHRERQRHEPKYGTVGERHVDAAVQERVGRQDDEGHPDQHERGRDADLRRPPDGEGAGRPPPVDRDVLGSPLDRRGHARPPASPLRAGSV